MVHSYVVPVSIIAVVQHGKIPLQRAHGVTVIYPVHKGFLRVALNRADFALARPFVQSVLDVSPDDPSANFAIGMDFFVQGQYVRAQTYLERCLKSRPNDPAVLNNLAQCHLRRGDPKGALPYAERALEILPNALEVRRTVERIKKQLSK